MTNYANLSNFEKATIKNLIKQKLNEFYPQKNNRSHDDSILEKAAMAILQIAVTYKIIEEKCLYNLCYVNRIKYHIMDSRLADDITNEILMTFQSYPTVLCLAVDKAIEEATYEQYENYYEMEL